MIGTEDIRPHVARQWTTWLLCLWLRLHETIFHKRLFLQVHNYLTHNLKKSPRENLFPKAIPHMNRSDQTQFIKNRLLNTLMMHLNQPRQQVPRHLAPRRTDIELQESWTKNPWTEGLYLRFPSMAELGKQKFHCNSEILWAYVRGRQ